MHIRGLALGALLGAALLAQAAGASAAPAKLVVTVRAPAAVAVGTPWRPSVTVTRGGKRVAGLAVRVRARLGGVARTVRAAPLRRGVYRAALRLPVPGRWAYAVLVRGRTHARGSVRAHRAAGTPSPQPPAPAPRCTQHAVPAPRGSFQEWNVANGSQVHPHDVWPAGDGTVWYTAQFKGALGRIAVATGALCEIPLGAGSSPHGVIAGPDGDAWVTDQGRNSVIRVDRVTEAITEYPVPAPFDVSPHTGTWGPDGILWFTGINGFIGRLDPALPPGQAIRVWPAPLGGGPYGIDATPSGDIWFVTLRGDGYLGKVDTETGAVERVAIPSPGAGPRRVWSDSQGRLWVTLWTSGHLGRYDPATARWTLWPVPPGATDSPYAVYVDAADVVWLTAFGPNALVRFAPATETFTSFPFPAAGSAVRQIVGDRSGIWGAASGVDGLLLHRTP